MTSKEILTFIDTALTLMTDKAFTTDHRLCEGTIDDQACLLTIWPVAGMRLVDEKVASRHGIVVAKIYNNGTAPDSKLHVQPKQTLYWIAVNDNAPVSKLIDLSGTMPRLVSTLKFKRCIDPSHPQPPHSSTFAAFKCCGTCPDTVRIKGQVLTGHTSSPWIACATGCCYADQ